MPALSNFVFATDTQVHWALSISQTGILRRTKVDQDHTCHVRVGGQDVLGVPGGERFGVIGSGGENQLPVVTQQDLVVS